MLNFLKKNYDEMAEQIIEAVGGKDNIDILEHCSTRIRVLVKNLDIINKDLLLKAGAKDIIANREDYIQIVVGTVAPMLYEKIKELLNK